MVQVPRGYTTDVFQSSDRGRYSIIIRSEENYYYKSRSFNVAEIGIFWRVSREFAKGQPHYSVAYTLNTTDFSPITGAAVTLTGELYTYDYQTDKYSLYSEELFAGISDFQGVTEIVVANARSNPFVVISDGKAVSVASAPLLSLVNAMKFIPTPPLVVLV